MHSNTQYPDMDVDFRLDFVTKLTYVPVCHWKDVCIYSVENFQSVVCSQNSES